MRKLTGLREPRIHAPDLPDDLAPAGQPELRGDHYQVEFGALSNEFDASYSMLDECRIAPASVNDINLRGATLTEVEIEGLATVRFGGRESRWRNVRVEGGRIATLDLSAATVSSVEFRGVRIDYLNLSGATLTDVGFRDCRLASVDLVDATATRVSFTDCTAEEFDTRGSHLQHVDLRGFEVVRFIDVTSLRDATLSTEQVVAHSTALAEAIGIHVLDGPQSSVGRTGYDVIRS